MPAKISPLRQCGSNIRTVALFASPCREEGLSFYQHNKFKGL
ncbi:hypothetical protein NEICINOT_03379 [Neisseria cinerea ATCC 14685]|uniref:Uncharacterized protein n=1 Tax=Neisseria cinerea ATCC 14685 TaxID=546262 RepID=D0W160_NEICI|nr:hypothetical protein NEICINOT_03379 [Neisseria cinerea ATCC 14685]EFH22745.1 hypothetical protein NEIPOLOT_01505 [Neisseria polysaccharea ATCC 43768]